jgi:hypothetical protein
VLAAGDDATLKVLKTVVDARKGDRDAQMQAARDALLKLMDRVSSLDEDRILRSFMGVIDATLRTSYYQTDANGQHGHVISFKFDSALVPDLPKPRPYREIFVYGPRVEGVHLRFGAVARGGLRWSDRREDFRTEVLGLVKAQMVKNTVIVPVGAKGGFFAKTRRWRRPRRDLRRRRRLLQAVHPGPAGHHRQHRQRQDRAAGGRGAPRHGRSVPGGGRRQGHRDLLRHRQRHGHRARLLAGRCVRLRRFGRLRPQGHGHHRAVRGNRSSATSVRWAVTARPGLHLRRHRRHVRRRVRQRHAAVAHIRLVAAFDHRHIFLDPNPDAATTFAERERLFTCRVRAGRTTTPS